MCPSNPKNQNDEAETLVTETDSKPSEAKQTLGQVNDDPNRTLTQVVVTGEVESVAAQQPTKIEVDKKGVPAKDDLKIEIPSFIVKKRHNIRVTYSAKAEATPFTIFRIFVFSMILVFGLALFFQQKKNQNMSKDSKLQSMGLLSELGRKVGLLPPLVDYDASAALNLIKLDTSLKNLKVTMNGQEIQINKKYELYVPLHTDLFIQISADGIRPHNVEIKFDKATTYQLKPKYFLANTGTLNLTTDKDVNITLYLDGELILEKSSPMISWPLPEGNYHAILQDDFLKIKKTIDFEVKSGQTTNVSEILEPKS